MALKFSKADEKHAITQFQANVSFAAALGAAELAQLSTVLSELAHAHDLPAKFVTPAFKFEFNGVDASNNVPQMASESGFQRFTPDGKVSARIAAAPQSLTFMSATYEGWEKLGPMLAEAFASLSEPFLKKAIPVSRLSLQYFNEFSSLDPGFQSTTEIFRKDTPWVSGLFNTSEDLWHSHVGQFVQFEAAKKLINVNADVVLANAAEREDDFTQVKMMIFAALLFDVPGTKPLVIIPDEKLGKFLELLNVAHDLEKDVLSNTLSDEYLREINAL